MKHEVKLMHGAYAPVEVHARDEAEAIAKVRARAQRAISRKGRKGRQEHKGDTVVIAVSAIEFREGGNTLWIHGPEGGTILRFKTLNGTITSKHCKTSPISHGDAIIQGDLEICIAVEDEI